LLLERCVLFFLPLVSYHLCSWLHTWLELGVVGTCSPGWYVIETGGGWFLELALVPCLAHQKLVLRQLLILSSLTPLLSEEIILLVTSSTTKRGWALTFLFGPLAPVLKYGKSVSDGWSLCHCLKARTLKIHCAASPEHLQVRLTFFRWVLWAAILLNFG
jgi:hypothetical protein